MGFQNSRIYEHEIAEDVKLFYTEQIQKGVDEVAVTQQLLSDYACVLSDSDDAPIFWLALADIQWKFGRLEDAVKEKAMYYIKLALRESSLESNGSSELFALEHRLNSTQPKKKKIRPHKFYRCNWKINDVYVYPLNSNVAKEKGFSNRYLLFHKIGETTWHPGHAVPIVRVKITEGSSIPQNISEINRLEYVQISSKKILPSEESNPRNSIPCYQLILVNIAKKIMPKSLMYLGNFPEIDAPDYEYIYANNVEIPAFIWKYFDSNIIDRYCGHNLKQYKMYQKTE